MAAVITDKNGRIFSWGWNSVGNGLGKHAEEHAIERANKKRLAGATITIAGKRVKTNKTVYSEPCKKCRSLIEAIDIKKIEFLTKEETWKVIEI